MEYGLHSDVEVRTAITPTDGAAAGASTVSAEIDTLDRESLTWLVTVGTITTGTFTLLLEESEDDGSGAADGVWTTVVADEQLGADVSWIVTDDDQSRRVGSIGKKRHQRVTIVGASTPVADFAAVALLGHPKRTVGDQSVAETPV